MPKKDQRGLVSGLVLLAWTAGQLAHAQVPVGPPEQVNTYTSGRQESPSVAIDPDGGFVVVWNSEGSQGTDGSGESIQGQRFGASGNPVGSEFQINTSTSGRQETPALAFDPDGDFVVVWSGYDSTGSAQLAEFQVNSYTTEAQTKPAIAVDEDGNFVVVWQSAGSLSTDTSLRSIQGQRFDSTGSPLLAEFQVNSYTTGNQSLPDVAMSPDGDFVVVWESFGSDGDFSYESVHGQRYSADGTALGAQFQVNTYTYYIQSAPSVAMDANGAFTVVWENNNTTGFKVQGQRYESDGTPIGGEFLISTYTSGNQRDPEIAMESDGDFVVTWQSFGSDENDASYTSVQVRRYILNPEIFADGFETGNTTAWM